MGGVCSFDLASMQVLGVDWLTFQSCADEVSSHASLFHADFGTVMWSRNFAQSTWTLLGRESSC